METLIVELMGLPHSGRTTLMRGLARELSQDGIRVCCFPEEARRSFLPAGQTDPFDSFTRSVNETVTNVIEAKASANQVVLVERGIFDHIASALAWQKVEGGIGEAKARTIIRYLEPHEEKENLIIFLSISAKTSSTRDQMGDLSMPAGLIANPEFLKQLQRAYEEVIKQIPKPKLLTINGKKAIPKVRAIALAAVHQRLKGSNPKALTEVLTLAKSSIPDEKREKRDRPLEALAGSLGRSGEKLRCHSREGV